MRNLNYKMVLALSCAQLWGSQSLVMSPALVGASVTLPSSRTYSGINGWRVDGQVDTYVANGANAVGLFSNDAIYPFDIRLNPSGGNIYLTLMGGSGEYITIAIGTVVAPPSYFYWRAQRVSSSSLYTLEYWSPATGAYLSGTAAVKSPGAKDMRGSHITIGTQYESSFGPNLHLGFVRWYSVTVALNSLPPVLLLTRSYATLGDWEFESNQNDSSGNGLTLPSSYGLTSYAPTAWLAPTIQLGATPLTVRAGTAATLDASLSYSNVDSAPLTFTWQQLAVPSAGVWSNQTAATASFTPPIFGTYNLQTSVTDATGQTSTVAFKLGGVASDDNDVVIVNDPAVSTILGPMIRFGANPWSWFDTANKYMADAVGNGLDAQFPVFWNTAASGTVAGTTGSATITGTGTTFTTTFCQGPGNPTVVQPGGTGIILWYPSSDYPGTTGRAMYMVDSCKDDTHLTIHTPFVFNSGGTTNGMQFTVLPGSSLAYYNWANGVTPGNYYDNVLAFYALYYRTGIDTYLNWARKLADEWWTMPVIDRGQEYAISSTQRNGSGFGEDREFALAGLMLRALDGHPEMWTGLNHFFECEIYYTVTHGMGSLGELRNHGYASGYLGLCGLINPTSYQTLCQAASVADAANLANLQQPTGNFVYSAAYYGTYGANGIGTGSMVKVTNGSPVVTLSSGTMDFTTIPATDPYGYPVNFWFSSANPHSNADGDAMAYSITATTPNTIILDSPYQGTSGVKAWATALAGMNGFGTQAFEEGLAAGSFDYARQAMLATGQTTAAAQYAAFEIQGAMWVWTTGYWPEPFSGVYYGRAYVNCEPAPGATYPAQSQMACTAGGLPNNYVFTRVDMGQVMPAFSNSYLAAPSPTLLTAGDTFYTSLWAKPGSNSPIAGDGYYMSSIDPTATGAYMAALDSTGTYIASAQQNKWFGFFFGKGGGYGWPAARVGGVMAPNFRTVSLPIDLNSVTGTASVNVTVVQPSGAAKVYNCATSPCAVKVDVRQGNHLVSIDYLSAAGSVLSHCKETALPVSR